MGNSAPIKTGIKVLDNTANNAIGAATLGAAGTSLNDLGKNLERNGQMVARNAVGIWQPGGLNNLGNSMLQNDMAILSGGTMNQEDIRKVAGESGVERKFREDGEKTAQNAAAATAADAAASLEETMRTISSTISGAVDSRRRAPGRRLSLLSGSGGSTATNTLLTTANKSGT